jgi:hypothetical protein
VEGVAFVQHTVMPGEIVFDVGENAKLMTLIWTSPIWQLVSARPTGTWLAAGTTATTASSSKRRIPIPETPTTLGG